MKYKSVLVILTALVIAEVIWLFWQIWKLKSYQAQPEIYNIQEKTVIKKGQSQGAKLWLEPKSGEFSEQFSVDIFVETPALIDGLDARLFYPKDKLLVVDQDIQTEGIQVKEGKLDQYPLNKVDEDQGLILLSGIVLSKDEGSVPLNQPFLAGRIIFKTIGRGEAALNFDFKRGSTIDCNVAGRKNNKDILKEVQGATFIL